MTIEKHTGIIRIIRAFGYSWHGFVAAYKSEAAFRQELALCLVLIPLAFYLPVTPMERALMVSTPLLVLIVELLNTAVETIIERISPEIHPLSKKAKDLGSASVLVALIIVAVVWAEVVIAHGWISSLF